jgi:small subunit ribosomal protein S16
MATRIRLRRMGAKKRPFYRVVVADQRAPRDGRFIENIGRYHPLADPSLIEIDQDRALHWLRQGAQPSDQVRTLLEKVGIWETFAAERPSVLKTRHVKPERIEKTKRSKKAAAKEASAVAEEPSREELAAETPTPEPVPTPEPEPTVQPDAEPSFEEATEPETSAETTEEAAADAPAEDDAEG